MAYSAAADVKAQLKITGSTDDTLIGELIDVADAMIDAATGEEWSQTTENRSYHAIEDVVGRDLLIDYASQINTVTNGDGSVIASTDYKLVRARRIRLERRVGLFWTWSAMDDPTDAIVINANWGRATTPVRVKQLSIDITCWLYRRQSVGQDSVLIVAQGGTHALQPSELPRELRYELLRLTPPRI